MLWQRVLTAALLVPIAVAAVWYLPTPALAALFTLIALLGAAEWTSLSGLTGRPFVAAYLLIAALAVLTATFALPLRLQPIVWWAAVLWWLVSTVWILRYPRGFTNEFPSRQMRAAVGLLIFASTVSALAAIHAKDFNGPALLLATFVIVWAADIGAYFAGRRFGRHKLAPRVSPGKTWEGFVGGFAAAVLAAALMTPWLFPDGRVPWFAWLALSGGVAIVSVVGDLAESLLKRHVGIKDSGRLLPGHGGVLDRVDSLLAVAPVMALGIDGLRL